jgi:hypothetical protein
MPAFVAVGTRATSAGAATISPAKPTIVGNAGGVLLAVVTSKNNAVHSCSTSGWSLVGSQINSGASFTASLWIAAEGAAAPTFTWTGSVACSAQVAYYWDSLGPMDVSVSASSNANGTTSTHTSAAFTSTRANALAVYIDVAAANTALATPAGWTEQVDAGSATDAGRTVWGDKVLGASGSSSGAISVTGAAAAWVQWQVELRVATSTGLDASKMEAGAWYDPGTGVDAAKIEVGAWLESPTEMAVAKIEVGAWLVASGGGGRRRQIANPF